MRTRGRTKGMRPCPQRCAQKQGTTWCRRLRLL
jgi:hypothetical protein